ncbi:MAG: hypothetical protein HUU54_14365 [Ignavibacteriaceae bacterium]|nr:hypothetical protein [Ignavibacteriaceae bacterium]
MSSYSGNNLQLRLSYWILLPVISAMVLGSFIRTGIDGYERAMFSEMIDGTAHKPFVYRALIPLAVKSITYAIPDNIEALIDKWGYEKINFVKKREGVRLTEISIVLFFSYLSIMGFAWSLHILGKHFYNFKEITGYIISLTAVAGIPVFFQYYSYMYDLPQLFLFTLSLYYLAKERWSYFLALFTITTINKETSILLILIFFIHYRQILPISEFRKLLALQFSIFAIIKLTLTSLFWENNGTFVEFHLKHNLFLAPFTISQFVSFILIGIGLSYAWNNKPKFLRNSLFILIPLLGLTFFLGLLDEYRDYYESYPIIVLLIYPSIHSLFNNSSGLMKNLPETLRKAV